MDRAHPTDHRAELADVWREQHRYLVDVAYRMLGDLAESEDTVQEAFTRLLRVDLAEIDDVRGWLVVVVGRLCLDRLKSARSRHETTVASWPAQEPTVATPAMDPADRVTLDDSVRSALFVVLERLTPAERASFVLHDVFQFSFEDIASIVGRTPAACRQLASRARRRIEDDDDVGRFMVGSAEEQRLVERFIDACANGDVDGLVAVLDPDVAGVAHLTRRVKVRRTGRARVVQGLLRHLGPRSGTTLLSFPVNGSPGILVFRGGRLFETVELTPRGGRVHHIHAVVDWRSVSGWTNALRPRRRG